MCFSAGWEGGNGIKIGWGRAPYRCPWGPAPDECRVGVPAIRGHMAPQLQFVRIDAARSARLQAKRRFSVIRLPTSELLAFLDVDFILFYLMMKIGQRCACSASTASFSTSPRFMRNQHLPPWFKKWTWYIRLIARGASNKWIDVRPEAKNRTDVSLKKRSDLVNRGKMIQHACSYGGWQPTREAPWKAQ